MRQLIKQKVMILFKTTFDFLCKAMLCSKSNGRQPKGDRVVDFSTNKHLIY